ncbi:MAG: hypothetical protein AMXMBFR74_23520 [Parvibaculum sp.]|uniref:hypothetical protein n=1 Tax=Parvibaculum sp. TaxID=2024848 RepID=UPI0035B82E9A
MTPADYMREIVLPTLAEFREDRRTRRHAYLACIVAFHIKDHLKQAGEKHPEEKLRAVTGGAFDLVRSVCNGAKHVVADKSHATAFTAGRDVDRPPAVAGQMMVGLSFLGDAYGGRSIVTDDRLVDVYVCVWRVVAAAMSQYPEHFREMKIFDL